jgi:hypothetical protein
VGAYVKDHGATVTAFYVSNVESYLQRAGTWPSFCANVATLPLDDASVFIRPSGSGVVLNRPLLNGVPTTTVVNGAASSSTFVTFVGVSGSSTSTLLPAGAGLVPMAAAVKSCGGG